jgi:dTDP-4-amino-4,6-dideoxygalactose transaminase
MKSIQKFAKDNDLKIIEDCAHALGTKFDKKHVGTFGETGCFSFYPTKNLTTFEGGMIITQSKKMAENLRSLRNHGITKSLRQRFTKGHPWDFDIKQMGYNFRIDEIRSSLGLNQLKKIKKMNKLRQSACKYYNKNLKNIDGISVYEDPKLESNSCHLYVIKILSNFGITRNNLFSNFVKNGIRTSVHYKPLHKFSLYKNKCKIYFPLKTSKTLYPQILSLPLFPQITKNEMNSVITVLKKQQK